MTVVESYGLERIQSVLLIALKKFDQLCRQNNISYALHGGTLLGAERNHKFIPWDDDVDVSMTRENYKKLSKVLVNNNDYYIDENYYWVPRFAKKNVNKSDFVFIDVFIWDFISENKFEQLLKINLLRFLQGMLKDELNLNNFSFFYKLLLILTWLLGKTMPRRVKIKIYKRISEYWLVGNKKYLHRSNDNFKSVSYIFDFNYMESYLNIEFEGQFFMVNKRYQEFLEQSYGLNYLIPITEEKRVSQHEKFRKRLHK